MLDALVAELAYGHYRVVLSAQYLSYRYDNAALEDRRHVVMNRRCML